MALKETVKHLKDLLAQITHDIDKADNGNKAASQRVRTGTVRLEKVAKLYRKESIKNEKTSKGPKKPAAKKASAKAKAKPAKAKAKAPAKSHKAASKGRALSVRKPTAKIPHRSR